MAISLIQQSSTITPAYNPVRFMYSSTNVNEPGFRYIYDIYEAGTANKIAEYRLLPNTDGYGEIDLSRLLQSYVSYDFDPTSTTNYDATNSYYEYDVKVGEEYIQTVSYTASLTQNGTYTKITATHSFQVGDQVVITQTSPGTDNPTLDGLHTVTAITTTTDFTVNVLWSEITDATIDGTVAYADNRKTVTRDIATNTGLFVYNGAQTFANFSNYQYEDYILDDSGDFFYTTMPYGFSITPTQDLWFNFGITEVSTGYVYFENSTGDIFRRAISDTGLISQVMVSPDASGLTVVSGSAPLVDDSVEYYDVWYADSLFAQSSDKYRITIDRRCTINDYEIAFLDRLGSIGSFAFQLRDKLTGTVTKDTYNQRIEGFTEAGGVASQFKYNLYDQGQRVINPRIKEVYDLNTNWMSEDDAAYFTELVSSPQTWIKIDDRYFSCIVETTGYEKFRQRNRNLIKQSIQVSLSVQDRING